MKPSKLTLAALAVTAAAASAPVLAHHRSGHYPYGHSYVVPRSEVVVTATPGYYYYVEPRSYYYEPVRQYYYYEPAPTYSYAPPGYYYYYDSAYPRNNSRD